jgi:glycosyltransferase involved in cell wall biosynthesis
VRRLLLVGNGPLEGALRDRAAELGLGDAVVFCGFLQSTEVANLLSRALALVLVSVEEQWGLVVNEAVALGLPVIVSEYVGHATFLCPIWLMDTSHHRGMWNKLPAPCFGWPGTNRNGCA